MGGAVVVLVAAQRPDLVRTLTLISPAVPDIQVARARRCAATRGWRCWSCPARRRRRCAAVRPLAPSSGCAAPSRSCFADPTRYPPQRLAEAIAEAKERAELPWADAGASCARCAGWRGRSSRGEPRCWAALRRITAPTLVLWGDSDRLVSPDLAPDVAAAIPDAAAAGARRRRAHRDDGGPGTTARPCWRCSRTSPTDRRDQLSRRRSGSATRCRLAAARSRCAACAAWAICHRGSAARIRSTPRPPRARTSTRRRRRRRARRSARGRTTRPRRRCAVSCGATAGGRTRCRCSSSITVVALLTATRQPAPKPAAGRAPAHQPARRRRRPPRAGRHRAEVRPASGRTRRTRRWPRRRCPPARPYTTTGTGTFRVLPGHAAGRRHRHAAPLHDRGRERHHRHRPDAVRDDGADGAVRPAQLGRATACPAAGRLRPVDFHVTLTSSMTVREAAAATTSRSRRRASRRAGSTPAAT